VVYVYFLNSSALSSSLPLYFVILADTSINFLLLLMLKSSFFTGLAAAGISG